MELSILTFIILIIMPFVFLILSFRPTLEGYEYVKISFLVLTAILFLIAGLVFAMTGGISIAFMDNGLEKKNLLTPGSLSPVNDLNGTGGDAILNSLCNNQLSAGGLSFYWGFQVAGCSDPENNVNFQGFAEANDKIILFAVDGQYSDEKITQLSRAQVAAIYESVGLGSSLHPQIDSHSYYYKESNPIVGSNLDMYILSAVYSMIGVIHVIFSIGEVFRIPSRKI